MARAQHVEAVRSRCLEGRRMICGRILKVLPEGLVVESGYTDLMRPPIITSWLVPGRVTAHLAVNQVERQAPEAVVYGVVLLTDLPKSHGPGPQPKPYDYVILMAYPTGQASYTSVGTIQKTVRRFAGNLIKAVHHNLDLEAGINPAATSGAGVK